MINNRINFLVILKHHPSSACPTHRESPDRCSSTKGSPSFTCQRKNIPTAQIPLIQFGERNLLGGCHSPTIGWGDHGDHGQRLTILVTLPRPETANLHWRLGICGCSNHYMACWRNRNLMKYWPIDCTWTAEKHLDSVPFIGDFYSGKNY